MSTHLCKDHDEDCPGIFAEGYCLKCWLHDPARGFCPYLRSTEEPVNAETVSEVTK
jgi:hypothetical protein